MLKTFICGHRNPDVDSVASACALADLRQRINPAGDYEPICPGRLPLRAKWLFEHWHIPPPRSRGDVYVRVRDLISPDVPFIPADMTLLTALKTLEASGESSLAVAERGGRFIGMLSPSKLLSYFLEKKDMLIPVARAPLHACTQVLNEADRVHDVKATAIRNAHNHFPVTDATGRYLGTVLKRAFAEVPPVQMILVDHNETEQGIPGLEEIPVVEVVDHHRISFTSRREPIKYTADTVGSTCTIVARMFRAAGLRPAKAIAGLLLGGIVADTLNFQSPTTTNDDHLIAAWLTKLCGETPEILMEGMLSTGSALVSMAPDQALESDRKLYHEAGKTFALAQLEESNLALFHAQVPALAKALADDVTRNGLDFAALLVTDPVRGDSELLFSGDEAVQRALPWRRSSTGVFSLPGVLSRKKQLLPEILQSISD